MILFWPKRSYNFHAHLLNLAKFLYYVPLLVSPLPFKSAKNLSSHPSINPFTPSRFKKNPPFSGNDAIIWFLSAAQIAVKTSIMPSAAWKLNFFSFPRLLGHAHNSKFGTGKTPYLVVFPVFSAQSWCFWFSIRLFGGFVGHLKVFVRIKKDFN